MSNQEQPRAAQNNQRPSRAISNHQEHSKGLQFSFNLLFCIAHGAERPLVSVRLLLEDIELALKLINCMFAMLNYLEQMFICLEYAFGLL